MPSNVTCSAAPLSMRRSSGSAPIEDERQLVRLISVLYHGTWYRYLTNELDTARLPAPYAVALYWQRWRIEDAYAIVKRLLGLAYFVLAPRTAWPSNCGRLGCCT